MRRVLTADRQKYEALADVEGYQAYSPGELFAPVFASLAQPVGTVLDAGCCSGKGGLALAALGYDVTLCDYTDVHLTPEAKALPFTLVTTLWDCDSVAIAAGRPKGDVTDDVVPVDYVYCCDVLEHIPREFTMLVVRNLLDVTARGAFFSISLVPDTFGAWIGETLHETLQPFTWWRDRLAELGTVVDARDLHGVALFYVMP